MQKLRLTLQVDCDLQDLRPVCTSFFEDSSDALKAYRRLGLDTSLGYTAVYEWNLARNEDEVAIFGTAGYQRKYNIVGNPLLMSAEGLAKEP